MSHPSGPPIGEWISVFFAHFCELYGDDELAAVATASIVNELLAEYEEEQQCFAV